MNILVSTYHNSAIKIFFNFTLSICTLIILLPIFLLISLLIKSYNHGPILFRQKRVGINGKIFTIIKFRTMVVNAEKLKNKYRHLNISDGPAFKIPDDPRYTKFGKYLAMSGLDELPQLINVVKGEMSLVGPRPLPIYEAAKLTKSQKIRELVKPGITSTWIVQGAHNLEFREWMELDKKYVNSGSLKVDITVLLRTSVNIIKQILLLLRKS
jgi:lipopolysaccharide/colanic/teichoic acid biosynthesis glycosyltransferase